MNTEGKKRRDPMGREQKEKRVQSQAVLHQAGVSPTDFTADATAQLQKSHCFAPASPERFA